MRIEVLAYERCLEAKCFGFTDVLPLANRAALDRAPSDKPSFKVNLVGCRAIGEHNPRDAIRPLSGGAGTLMSRTAA